jgi:hypothetical protein
MFPAALTKINETIAHLAFKLDIRPTAFPYWLESENEVFAAISLNMRRFAFLKPSGRRTLP